MASKRQAADVNGAGFPVGSFAGLGARDRLGGSSVEVYSDEQLTGAKINILVKIKMNRVPFHLIFLSFFPP